MRGRIAIAAGVAAVLIGCYGPGEGVNPNHPPKPAPHPTGSHATTRPPAGVEVRYESR